MAPVLYQSGVCRRARLHVHCAVVMGAVCLPGQSQNFSRVDREQARTMLKDVASDIRQHYYDAKFHGVDLEAKVREGMERIAQAPSYDVASTDIAAFFETLNDSHSFYVPPGHFTKQEYGWRFQMVGSKCLVTQVNPKSDAAAKGLKPGDQVLTIEGFTPERDSLIRLKNVINTLMPMRSLTVDVLDSSNHLRKLSLMAQMKTGKQVSDSMDLTGGDQWMKRLEQERQLRSVRVRYKEAGSDLLIVKLPEFVETELEVDELLAKARKHKSLILDLRGSPGGSEETLQYLLGGLFNREIKIADRISRTETKPLSTKHGSHAVFSGNVVVLVDSQSASASELFARTIQIQKRGTVMGDRTAGATMEAEHYFHKTGINPVFYYGASITVADLILPDGKSLEHAGVTPDITALPSSSDLQNNRDPVLSRAAALLGVELSAEDACKLFPYEWQSE